MRSFGHQRRVIGMPSLGTDPTELACQTADRRRCCGISEPPRRAVRSDQLAEHVPERCTSESEPVGQRGMAEPGDVMQACGVRKAMPSGSVMSRPCAQCSASRVVASVAGLGGASAHCNRRSGSAARSATTAARRADRQRSKTTCGDGRSACTRRSTAASSVSPSTLQLPARSRSSLAETVSNTPSSVCARWSTTSVIVQPGEQQDQHHRAGSDDRIGDVRYMGRRLH